MSREISLARFAPIGDFILGTRPSRLPQEVRRFASLLLLDTLGVAAAAATMEPARIAREVATRLYRAGPDGPAAKLLFDGRNVSVPGAVFAAAAQIDNLDAHDGYNPSKGHTGVVVVPALLAFAQTLPALPARQAIDALVIGYEVGARAAIALHKTASDYHSSGAWNALAVAALGARLSKLRADQLRDALGIAEYHGPRSQMMRVIDHPTMLHDGSAFGALAGASAVFLAQAGYTGAPAITVESDAVSELWEDLGETFRITQHYIKPYPICRWAHALIEGALKLRSEHAFVLDEIVSIELATFREAARLFRGVPRTSPVAQYAIAFPVAAALANGHLGVHELADASLRDENISRLVALTSIREEDAYNREFPKSRLGDVELVLRDGSRLRSGTLDARGGPEAPMTESEIITKYREYATPALGRRRAHALETSVLELCEDHGDFCSVLALTSKKSGRLSAPARPGHETSDVAKARRIS
ncbi:MAG: MmgE/PrpD family protein [Hyphomicrobiales bacterium]|nr:MmgE/PrpD family protein [Hyphomicrobiales bacterium]